VAHPSCTNAGAGDLRGIVPRAEINRQPSAPIRIDDAHVNGWRGYGDDVRTKRSRDKRSGLPFFRKTSSLHDQKRGEGFIGVL